ncbi:hypothetical protein LX32DRAFT_432044 [Colletotrichum zoysiae]|uniref:Uncharacterized protein n=1 Tax=Colletotrichum zoysiae TaxID=1216348 RepID=A0AAD9HEY6_9PEZI|nr:hypothetical protein LX32DRAFT_432044 [Colletotrichum zoysiae]
MAKKEYDVDVYQKNTESIAAVPTPLVTSITLRERFYCMMPNKTDRLHTNHRYRARPRHSLSLSMCVCVCVFVCVCV